MITLDVLRTIPLLASLEDAALRKVAMAAADVRLIEGEWLVREGEQPAFFLLLSGDLEVSKTVGGSEQVLNHYHLRRGSA
jgi:thioredoxin reductase (NADPH)